MSSQGFPSVHSALVCTSRDKPLTVEKRPIPQSTPGSAVARIAGVGIVSYAREVYDGTRPYTFPTPVTIGTSAIGRIASIGPDATLLKPGQLVYIDGTVRSRDNPQDVFLSGVHDGYSEGSKSLMAGEWRDGTCAEYAKVPLENVTVLNEKHLLGPKSEGGLGYTVEQLVYFSRILVPFGGLRDVGLRAGETVIISPATGPFGSAAVIVALALGARVIAMGRNRSILNSLASKNPGRVYVVPITGDADADTAALSAFGSIDVFFDISPPQAIGSTHFRSAICALRHGGRVSLMGGMRGDVAIPHSVVMHRNLTLKGCWMYPREAIGDLLGMIEGGILNLEDAVESKDIKTFGLEEWSEAFDYAKEHTRLGEMTVITP
jgi:threonine dehydrogenase-like Zn-dependent dehydrogenase